MPRQNQRQEESLAPGVSETAFADNHKPKLVSDRPSLSLTNTSAGRRFTACNTAFEESLKAEILPPGTVIGEVYEIIELIGQGGMGVVYKVRHKSLNKVLAMKVLSSRHYSERSWKRFQAEAKSLAALNHPSLVAVYDLGVHNEKTPFYTMDYLEGRSLQQIIVEDGPLSVEEAIDVFVDVLDGLSYAHEQKIVHRDIKPANIFLRSTADGKRQVKILDFGIAKLSDLEAAASQSLTLAGDVFGSPYYMSPEQCLGEELDLRSDIYSLGCSLFEALTGEVPFEGKTVIATLMMHQNNKPPELSSFGKQFSPRLEGIISQCLEKNPEERPDSADALADELELVLDSANDKHYKRPGKKGKGGKAQAKQRKPWQKKSTTLLLAMSILLIGGTLSYFYVNSANPTLTKTDKQSKSPDKNPWRYTYTPTHTASRWIEFPAPAMTDVQQSSGMNEWLTRRNDSPPRRLSAYTPAFVDESNGIVINREDAYCKICDPVETTDFATGVNVFLPSPNLCQNPELFSVMNKVKIDAVDFTLLPSRIKTDASQDPKNTYERNFSAIVDQLKQYRHLTGLGLSGSMINDKDLLALNKLSGLKYLDLTDSKVTESGILTLKQLPQLNSLEISHLNNPSRLLKALADSQNLHRLVIGSCELSPDDIKTLSRCPNLEALALYDITISDEAMKILASMPHLKSLNIEYCDIELKDLLAFAKNDSLQRVVLQVPDGAELQQVLAALRTARVPKQYLYNDASKEDSAKILFTPFTDHTMPLPETDSINLFPKADTTKSQ